MIWPDLKIVGNPTVKRNPRTCSKMFFIQSIIFFSFHLLPKLTWQINIASFSWPFLSFAALKLISMRFVFLDSCTESFHFFRFYIFFHSSFQNEHHYESIFGLRQWLYAFVHFIFIICSRLEQKKKERREIKEITLVSLYIAMNTNNVYPKKHHITSHAVF